MREKTSEVSIVDDKYPQTREIHFAKAEKKERYEVLKSLVGKYRT